MTKWEKWTKKKRSVYGRADNKEECSATKRLTQMKISFDDDNDDTSGEFVTSTNFIFSHMYRINNFYFKKTEFLF
jgi:hypothetical protein